MKKFRPTKARIDIKAIQNNLKAVQQHVRKDTKVIAIVKANGYGHGQVEVARAVIETGVDMIGVATPDEALQLREAGIASEILVLAPSPIEFVPYATKYNISLAVSSETWLEAAIKQVELTAKPLKIHIKIDGGMGRTGVRNCKVIQALDALVQKSDQIHIEGAFMQFSNSDAESRERTDEQYRFFQELVSCLKEKPRLLHVSNSAGAILYPEYELDAVRIGIAMYGIVASEYVAKQIPFSIERAMTIVSELTVVKRMEKGSTIGYGGTYVTEADEWIGTIPLGYADGLQRNLKGQEVLIAGERMPIIGSICMDQCMVKLTKEIPVGEPVVLIGKQGEEEIRVEEWANRLNTVAYEIIVSIGNRIPRVYNE